MMPAALRPGAVLDGRYRVLGPLGRGGMGGVVEVQDAWGRRFAVKSPLADTGGTNDVTARFAREANALRLLEHPNLVAALDVFVDSGQLFLVMEKVEGESLGGRLRGMGALPPRQALVLARQILEGVG